MVVLPGKRTPDAMYANTLRSDWERLEFGGLVRRACATMISTV